MKAAAALVLIALTPGCGTSDSELARGTIDGGNEDSGPSPWEAGSATGGVPSGTGGRSGTGGAAGGDSKCAPSRAGPALVRVISPTGTAHCVDSTEVTGAQYAAFMAAKGADMSGQPPICKWNTTYKPACAAAQGDYPVVCIDWCDADAYCAWAGKHLCGKIGGGPNTISDAADATKSEWFDACSKGGTLSYAFGNTYLATACNGVGNGAAATVPVGSKATCEGGYPGLFDMSGNVWEWQYACDAATGMNDSCLMQGGSYVNDQGMQCSWWLDEKRNAFLETLGFRCCAASQ